LSPKDFVIWLQGYYGPIPSGQREDLAEYLRPLAPSYLEALKGAVARRFSSQYGKTPDIAVFESCRSEALDGQDAIVRARLTALPPPPEGEVGELIEIDWAAVFGAALTKSREISRSGR